MLPIVSETVELAVQVNGKTRGTIVVSPLVTEEEALAAVMGEPGIAKFVTGVPKKVILVKGRLVSVVV